MVVITAHTGKHQFTFSYSKTQTMIGLNSKLEDGNHVLMWDFDDITLTQLETILREVQDTFTLPSIYILKTNKFNGYHAYCLKRYSFIHAMHILTVSDGIDPQFLRLGACRGFWTLRLSPKRGVELTKVSTLISTIPEDVTIDELTNLVEYRTKIDKAIPNKVIRLGRGKH